MEKESLVHSLDYIEKIFQSFFDFNVIFSPYGNGRVTINKEYMKESQINIANKISFLATIIGVNENYDILSFDIADIVQSIQDVDCKEIDDEKILFIMNQLALKHKNFQSIKQQMRG